MSRLVRILCLGALVAVLVSGGAGCLYLGGLPGGFSFPSIRI